MKIFLPFTINLDPYIKKKIKEEQQAIDEEASYPGVYKWNTAAAPDPGWNMMNRSAATNRHSRVPRSHLPPAAPPALPPPPPVWSNYRPVYDWQMPQWSHVQPQLEHVQKPLSAVTNLPVRYLNYKNN